MPVEVLKLLCAPGIFQVAAGRTVPLLAVAGSQRHVCSLRLWHW